MTAYTHPLVEFLGFQLDEQADLAKTCLLPEHAHPYGDKRIPASRPDQWARDLDNYLGGPYGKQAGYWSPTLVLAEVSAKRQILELHGAVEDKTVLGAESHDWLFCTECGDVDDRPTAWPCQTIKWLGQPYQDHDGYQGSWSVHAPN